MISTQYGISMQCHIKKMHRDWQTTVNFHPPPHISVQAWAATLLLLLLLCSVFYWHCSVQA